MHAFGALDIVWHFGQSFTYADYIHVQALSSMDKIGIQQNLSIKDAPK